MLLIYSAFVKYERHDTPETYPALTVALSSAPPSYPVLENTL